MRDVDADFTTEKNKMENRPCHLYTVEDYDGAGTNLYYAEHDEDVTFDGVAYTAFPIKFDAVSENQGGEIDRVTITVGNVNRVIQAYLEAYDFRGKKVTVKTVWLNDLADTDNYINDIFYIDKYTANEKAAQFELSTRFDVLDINLPLRKYSRNYCGWKFKSDECGYSGAELACNKTKARCKELNNFSRFGGFPSIQSNKVIIG